MAFWPNVVQPYNPCMLAKFCLLIGSLLLVCACAPDPTSDWKELDLMPHDVPLKVLAPDSAKVTKASFSGLIQDVTVVSEADDYQLQIVGSQAITNDMARLKAAQIEYVRDNRYFERIVREDPDGFLFENRIDSTGYFGFRYIVYRGDREYVLQNTLSSTLTEEQAEAIYQAVRQQPRN